MAFEWVAPRRGRTGRSDGAFSRQGVRIAVFEVSRKDKRNAAAQMTVTVEEDFMRQMRWQAGDRVVVGINEMALALRRVNDDGFSLGPIAPKEERSKLFGKTVRTVIKVSVPAGWPLRPGDVLSCAHPTVDAEGTVMIPFSSEIRGRPVFELKPTEEAR